jgi:hypothetical protein
MSMRKVNAKVREAIVSGIFYPDQPAELERVVGKALDAAKTRYVEHARATPSSAATKLAAGAILAPHAGLSYSGAVQAMAWQAAAGRSIERVIILAPHHRGKNPSVFLPESAVFQTPLGDIAVDETLCAEIESCATLFETSDIPHLEEHAIEVQLPFMKLLFPQARLIPLIIGSIDANAVISVARALDMVLDSLWETTLLVASGNLASSTDLDEGRTQSDYIVQLIDHADWQGLVAAKEQGVLNGCACNVLAVLLASASTRGTVYRLLERRDSRIPEEDPIDRVVHYAAAAWFTGSKL